MSDAKKQLVKSNKIFEGTIILLLVLRIIIDLIWRIYYRMIRRWCKIVQYVGSKKEIYY